ncbi:hypothetical protein J7E95_33925 [Streptomyces sp. ISL-14]|nr:hypothetical protein [Streptomyces sp. ISL-14]
MITLIVLTKRTRRSIPRFRESAAAVDGRPDAAKREVNGPERVSGAGWPPGEQRREATRGIDLPDQKGCRTTSPLSSLDLATPNPGRRSNRRRPACRRHSGPSSRPRARPRGRPAWARQRSSRAASPR